MVLNDGETFSLLQGCQIVEIDNNIKDDEIEEYLDVLNKQNGYSSNARILGGFSINGDYLVGDPRIESKKKLIKLE